MEKALEILFEATKIMIPVVTGFIVLFTGAVGKMWQIQKSDESLTIKWLWVGVTLGLAICSLGFWSGVMPYCILASMGEPQDNLIIFKSVEQQRLFLLGRYCARIGHILFFLSVISSCIFMWKSLHSDIKIK